MSGATKENRTRNKCVGGKNGVEASMVDTMRKCRPRRFGSVIRREETEAVN